MTPENSGQDILKEYAATQAKLKEIERERDLAARDLERAKAELQQIDQEMKDNKGYSPLNDMQERGGTEAYLAFVINWVSRMEEATQESLTDANQVINLLKTRALRLLTAPCQRSGLRTLHPLGTVNRKSIPLLLLRLWWRNQ